MLCTADIMIYVHWTWCLLLCTEIFVKYHVYQVGSTEGIANLPHSIFDRFTYKTGWFDSESGDSDIFGKIIQPWV